MTIIINAGNNIINWSSCLNPKSKWKWGSWWLVLVAHGPAVYSLLLLQPTAALRCIIK
jgi:hypothetical protein